MKKKQSEMGCFFFYVYFEKKEVCLMESYLTAVGMLFLMMLVVILSCLFVKLLIIIGKKETRKIEKNKEKEL